MLVDAIKARMFRAIKAGENIEKEILRVAVGEITTDAARPGREGTDEEAAGILRKLVKSNEESLAATQDPAQRAALTREIEVIQEFLPRSLGEEEVVAALAPVGDQVAAAKSDGQATGVAMKHLKGAGLTVDGKVVAAAVQRLRSRG